MRIITGLAKGKRLVTPDGLDVRPTPEKVKETIENRENESGDDHEHGGYNEIEGENNVLIEEGSYDYYYKKDDPEKGVGYIVSYAESFGFKTGDVISEVETALASYDVKKEKASEQKLDNKYQTLNQEFMDLNV